jgi:hypothetical protein
MPTVNSVCSWKKSRSAILDVQMALSDQPSTYSKKFDKTGKSQGKGTYSQQHLLVSILDTDEASAHMNGRQPLHPIFIKILQLLPPAADIKG